MATKDEVELRDLEAFIERNAAKLERGAAMLAELQAKVVRLGATVSRWEELEAEVARLRALTSRRGSTLPGRLSVSRIEKLIKEGKVGTYGDGGNLWLQITNGGRAVSWLLRWKLHGRGDNMGLGSYKDVGLEEAREKALHYRRLLRRGKNPKAERDNVRLDEQIVAGRAKTVSQVADEYFEAKIARKSAIYRVNTTRHLKTYVHDKIGNMPIQKVDQNTILETCGLRDLWMRKHRTGQLVRTHLDRMFRLAESRKYFHGENPASWESLQHVLPASDDVHQVKHHASLPYKDAGRFMQELRTCKYKNWRGGGRPPSTFALEFIILTGVRINEVLKATWKEFDLEHMIWNVPPEHKKNKKTARPIPITKPMLAVLEEMQKRRVDQSPDAIVFRSPRDYGLPMVKTTLRNARDLMLKWEVKITNHGFRSTLRDWCRANRFPSEWWDIQVDHVLGNQTSQSYGHDPLIEERRGMMELWGEYCSKPAREPKAGKVFNLSDKRRSV